MPVGAAAVVMLVRFTVWPEPSEGVTGLGEYVTGVAPVSVPVLRGLFACRLSASVVSVTWLPRNCWLQATFIEPAAATVPVVGSAIVAGGVIVKSGIDMTLPG